MKKFIIIFIGFLFVVGLLYNNGKDDEYKSSNTKQETSIPQKTKEKKETPKVNENEVSEEDKSRLKDYSIDIIDSVLKSPSTSEYSGGFFDPYDGWTFTKQNGIVTIASFVDAQNSFGATIRSTFIIQVQMREDGSGDAIYVELDGKVLKGVYK